MMIQAILLLLLAFNVFSSDNRLGRFAAIKDEHAASEKAFAEHGHRRTLLAAPELEEEKISSFDELDYYARITDSTVLTTATSVSNANETAEFTTEIESSGASESSTETDSSTETESSMETKSSTEAKSSMESDTSAETESIATTEAVTSTEVVTPTEPATTTEASPTTTSIPTTESTSTEVTTMAPTTTLAPTTLTTKRTSPVTTAKPTIRMPTTKRLRTTAKPPKTTTSYPILSTTELMSDIDNDRLCAFTEGDLQCDEEVHCYGEGEIDCTDISDDVLSAALGISSTPNHPDYMIEYEEDDSDTSGEYPPELIGRVSSKPIPFMLKIKGFESSPSTSSDVSDDESDEGKSSASTTTTIQITIGNGDQDSSDASTTPTASADSSSSDDGVSQTITIKTETFSDSENSESSTQTSEAMSTTTVTDAAVNVSTSIAIATATAAATATTEPPTTVPPTESATEESSKPATNVEPTVESLLFPKATTVHQNLRFIIDDVFEESKQKVAERVKRDKNRIFSSASESSSSSMSASLHSAALEGLKQKKHLKTCKLSGNLKCLPAPSLAFCTGRSVCKEIASTAETLEKSSHVDGIANWTIAVITICAAAAAVTVMLLVWLVVTSWKKLKVQPQNGVTTLTYVNSTPP